MVPWIWFAEGDQYWGWFVAILSVELVIGLIVLIIGLATGRIDLLDSKLLGIYDGEELVSSTLSTIGWIVVGMIVVAFLQWVAAIIAVIIGVILLYNQIEDRAET